MCADGKQAFQLPRTAEEIYADAERMRKEREERKDTEGRDEIPKKDSSK